jgi:CRP-like cAMP-binding protein
MNAPLLTKPATPASCSPAACPCTRPCDEAAEHSPLFALGETVRFKRGEVLWAQGEPARHLIAVCTGVLKLTREWPDGREAILDLAFRGRMVGELAALPGTLQPTRCVALSAGRAVRVSAERLQKLLKDDPRLASTLLDLALRRQGAFTQRLDEMSHGPVENRLARVLLRIGDEVGLKDSRGTFVPVRLSRGDLADMVGCRVETTIRVMTRWQREGVVETQREGLVIRDKDTLSETARLSA